MSEDEAIDASVRGKKGADTVATERLDIANKYYGLLKWLAGGLILATAWVVTIQIDVNALKVLRGQRESQIEALKTYDAGNDKIIGQIGARIDQQRQDIDRVTGRMDKIEPDVQDMIFMRDNGISNKERFQRRYGYPAPEAATNKPEK